MRTIAAIAVVIAIGVSPLPSRSQEDGAGGAAQLDVARLLEDVNAVANALAEDIAGMGEAFSAAANSSEEAAEALAQARASVESAHDSLADDSEIWRQLSLALEVWDRNRMDALARSGAEPAFDEIAAEWGRRLEQARALRLGIIAQRAEMAALLHRIESDADVIVAYYELEQADRALATMQQVSENLERINASMRTLVERTSLVGAAPVAQ